MEETLIPAIKRRMRRLRKQPKLRHMLQQVRVVPADLVMPLFVCTGTDVTRPIHSMPGCAQMSVDQLPAAVERLQAVGLGSVMLFGIPAYKDSRGSSAIDENGIVQQATRVIKQHYPELLVIADLCFCEYTDHGHCGVLCEDLLLGQDVDNDTTLRLLAQQAVSLAKSGVDIVAPSGMMDHMVASVRMGLDQAGFQNIPILSYAVKYASNCYGPFRDAAEGGMQFELMQLM